MTSWQFKSPASVMYGLISLPRYCYQIFSITLHTHRDAFRQMGLPCLFDHIENRESCFYWYSMISEFALLFLQLQTWWKRFTVQGEYEITSRITSFYTNTCNILMKHDALDLKLVPNNRQEQNWLHSFCEVYLIIILDQIDDNLLHINRDSFCKHELLIVQQKKKT